MKQARISRFERQILIAVFLSGLVPFVLSLVFIPLIVQAHYSLFVHQRVVDQLEASTLFYKEFFNTKKSEFAARVETISKDPVLIAAAVEARLPDIESRIQQLIDDNEDLRAVRVFGAEGATLAELTGPADRQTDEFVEKRLALPLGLGESAPRVEAVFIFPQRYLEDREQAEEIATLYRTAVQLGSMYEQEQLRAYIAIISAVLLVALGLGFWLARRVTKRIAELANATERVAEGDLDFSIEARGHDEITELSGAFNKMIAEVKNSRDRIVYLEKVSGWQEIARRLAHEIKNPLTPIQLAVQELRRRTPETDPEHRRFVEDAADMVEEEIRALTRLVDEFSQFARLPEVVPEDVELREFIEELLKAYNHFEPDAQIELLLPEEPLTVVIDRVLMRRVLANLAENAIQAAGAGKAKLRISMSRVADGDIEIRFEDNGPGLASDAEATIFEPYFTTKDTGTGLGLAIVKKIVLQHGGSIAAGTSELGGASFVIRLPAPERAHRAISAQPRKPAPGLA